MRLVDGALGIRCMMQHSVRIEQVEAGIGEGQTFGVRDTQGCRDKTLLRKALLHHSDRALGEVDPSITGTGAGKVDRIGAEPTTDLEDVAAAPVWKIDDRGYVRFGRIAV